MHPNACARAVSRLISVVVLSFVFFPSSMTGQRVREARANVSIHTAHSVRLDNGEDAVSDDAKRRIVAGAGLTALPVATTAAMAAAYTAAHSGQRIGRGIGLPTAAVWGYAIGFGVGAALGAHNQAERSGPIAREIALNMVVAAASVQLARATNSLVPLLIMMPVQGIIPSAIEVQALRHTRR